MKVCVTVPRTHANTVREAIGNAGGGKIGNYSFCSFSSVGTGRFKPENGAHPAIGEIGALEEVEEERIEFVCEPALIEKVVAAIRLVHPYDEPAIDAFLVEIL